MRVALGGLFISQHTRNRTGPHFWKRHLIQVNRADSRETEQAERHVRILTSFLHIIRTCQYDPDLKLGKSMRCKLIALTHEHTESEERTKRSCTK